MGHNFSSFFTFFKLSLFFIYFSFVCYLFIHLFLCKHLFVFFILLLRQNIVYFIYKFAKLTATMRSLLLPLCKGLIIFNFNINKGNKYLITKN